MRQPDERSPHRLLVEGSNDKHAVLGLLRRQFPVPKHPDRLPWIAERGGVDGALDALRTELKLLDRLGVVVDADTDVAGRWTALRDRCRDAGVTLPDAPDPSGTIVETPRGGFGVWLMPDNRVEGALEAFLDTMIPEHDRVRGLARAATRRARRVGAPFRITDEPKAILGAWLAWQNPPAKPYGTAITSRVLGDSELARRFVDWLSRLFELE